MISIYEIYQQIQNVLLIICADMIQAAVDEATVDVEGVSDVTVMDTDVSGVFTAGCKHSNQRQKF